MPAVVMQEEGATPAHVVFSFLSCSLPCTLFVVVSRAVRESVLPRELELEEFAG